MSKIPACVVGDGWSALSTVAALAAEGTAVTWAPGTGTRWVPPLPSMQAGSGAQAFLAVLEKLGISAGEIKAGSFLREFRNKAFRKPTWLDQASNDEEAQALLLSSLQPGEHRLTGVYEQAYQNLSLMDLDQLLRETLAQRPEVQRIEPCQVSAIRAEEGAVTVELGDGRRIVCERLFYADLWSTISSIQGLPAALAGSSGKVKVIDLARKAKPQALIQ
jgi:2-polyprenyl-6-methoxyphenol hydroxylase-like FAD-dependent oxidoreductase